MTRNNIYTFFTFPSFIQILVCATAILLLACSNNATTQDISRGYINTYSRNPNPVLLKHPSEENMLIADEITVRLIPNYSSEMINTVLGKVDGTLIGENTDLRYIYVRISHPASTYQQLVGLITEVKKFNFVEDSFPVMVSYGTQ